jgi:hypothetical protein
MIGKAPRCATTLLVLTLVGVVHAVPALSQAKSKAGKANQPAAASDVLPRGVSEMIDAIQAAVRSGQIADLDDAVDWNEMKPDLGPTFVSNPVAYWKSISKSGDGRDILDILGKLLAGKPAVLPLGKDIENNKFYVWPAFVETPLSKLSLAEIEALQALTTDDALKAMREKDRYTGWRLVIGADGTWHSFRAD